MIFVDSTMLDFAHHTIYSTGIMPLAHLQHQCQQYLGCMLGKPLSDMQTYLLTDLPWRSQIDGAYVSKFCGSLSRTGLIPSNSFTRSVWVIIEHELCMMKFHNFVLNKTIQILPEISAD